MDFLPQYPELTPTMRAVLQRMARANHPPLHTLPPQEARAAYAAGAITLQAAASLQRAFDAHFTDDAEAEERRMRLPSWKPHRPRRSSPI